MDQYQPEGAQEQDEVYQPPTDQTEGNNPYSNGGSDASSPYNGSPYGKAPGSPPYHTKEESHVNMAKILEQQALEAQLMKEREIEARITANAKIEAAKEAEKLAQENADLDAQLVALKKAAILAEKRAALKKIQDEIDASTANEAVQTAKQREDARRRAEESRIMELNRLEDEKLERIRLAEERNRLAEQKAKLEKKVALQAAADALAAEEEQLAEKRHLEQARINAAHYQAQLEEERKQLEREKKAKIQRKYEANVAEEERLSKLSYWFSYWPQLSGGQKLRIGLFWFIMLAIGLCVAFLFQLPPTISRFITIIWPDTYTWFGRFTYRITFLASLLIVAYQIYRIIL